MISVTLATIFGIPEIAAIIGTSISIIAINVFSYFLCTQCGDPKHPNGG